MRSVCKSRRAKYKNETHAARCLHDVDDFHDSTIYFLEYHEGMTGMISAFATIALVTK